MSDQVTVEIPIIDISGCLTGEPGAKEKVAAELRLACEEQGFLQKRKRSRSRTQNAIGATRGSEGQKLDELDTSATPDQKEGFSYRPERRLGKFLQGPNQWPENLPGFREAYETYFEAVHQLSMTMFRLMALSLDLPDDYFDYFASDPDGLCLCRAHHYPPTPPDVAGRTRGVGAHTDFGALTLLLQDQEKLADLKSSTKRLINTWHHVPPIERAYVCNIGDLMQRWTNDRYKSTMHRVISPLSGKDRYSCAFFNDGPMDMMVECLPTCIPRGQEAHYKPIKVVDHVGPRYVQSYGAAGTVLTVA